MSTNRYLFTVYVTGTGDCEEDAWEDAQENLADTDYDEARELNEEE